MTFLAAASSSNPGSGSRSSKSDGDNVNDGGAGASTTRVLLVDDDADSRELYAELLSRKGHAVTTAEDGEAALAAILGGSFDVAVLDVTLPGIDGAEVARRAREALGEGAPRLVAMTGHSPPSRNRPTLPFDAYLVKPVSMVAFLAEIAAARGPRCA